MVASLCCFNPFLPVEAMRCIHLSFAVRRTSLPLIITMARRMLNGLALHQICVQVHRKPLYHIPRNFYPSGDGSIAVTTSDFPNQLFYLLLQRNRKQIQVKQQHEGAPTGTVFCKITVRRSKLLPRNLLYLRRAKKF